MRYLAGAHFPIWIIVVVGIGAGLLHSSPPLAAQGRALTWQVMPVPTGGRINALTINPSNPSVLVAGTDFGIYLSNDGGESWVESNRGLPLEREILSLGISPNNPNLYYAGGTRCRR